MKIKTVVFVLIVFIVSLSSINIFSQVNTQWISRFSGSTGSNDAPVALASDLEGNYYCGGYTITQNTGMDYLIIKYNSSGEELWKKTFNGKGSKTDELNAISVDGSGNLIVTGSSTNETGLFDYVTIKYNPSGEELWRSAYDGPGKGNDGAIGLVVDKENNIYVTGYSSQEGDESVDIVTIKYDGGSGNPIWNMKYNNPNNNVDYPSGISIDDNNNIYICGYNKSPNTGFDYIVIKYTVNGAQLWSKTYNHKSSSNDKAVDIAVEPVSGSVFVTGTSIYNENTDYLTLKFNSTGELQWEARYNGTGNRIDEPSDISIDTYGNVYVTGKSDGNGTGSDYATIKYNSDGVELWAARFNDQGNSNDEATFVTADDNGSVYVTGSSWNGSNNDYCTIKYNPLGFELWVAKYNGPGNQVDKAVCLGTDSKGGVCVLGFSVGNESQYDFALIKYSQGVPEAVPQLVSPAFGSSGIIQTPSIEWSTLKNADYVKLQIANDKSFNSVVVDTNVSISTGVCKIPKNMLSDNTQYFWRVRAHNIVGAGQWSTVWTFSVLNAPDSPQLLSPQNGAAGQSVTPTLIWQKSPTAENYRIQISKDIAFSDIIHDINNLATNEYTLPNGLLDNNAQYFWRVNASNAGGTVPWSNTWSLGTGFVNPPEQPKLISLPNEALGQSLTPTLDWSDQSSVTSYRIQIASDLNFTKIAVDEGNLTNSNYTVQPGLLQSNTTYYWKVSATNLGGTGNWSHIWTFSTMGSGLTRLGKDVPSDFMLYNNTPEPFNGTTTIRFDIPSALDNTQIKILIFDEQGKEVSKILDEKIKPGSYKIDWDGSNFPRGYYLYQVRVKSQVQSKKMFLVK